eukprot:218664_1
MKSYLSYVLCILCLLCIFLIHSKSTYPYYKHGQKCMDCNRCGRPTACDLRIFGSGKCVGWASVGQSCVWTNCQKSYCDGKNCIGPKDFKISTDIHCLVNGENCTLGYACNLQNSSPADKCCYPMNCRTYDGSNHGPGRCLGDAKEGQQCVTTNCKEGYTCNELYVCEK